MGRCYIQHTYSIQSIVFRKKYRTMERKKRSKGSVWEFCYAKKKFGKFEEEMKASGQKWVTFCAHTHKHTHSAKLVVRIYANIMQRQLSWTELWRLRTPLPIRLAQSYKTTKLYGTFTCGWNNNAIFQKESSIFTFPTVDVFIAGYFLNFTFNSGAVVWNVIGVYRWILA